MGGIMDAGQMYVIKVKSGMSYYYVKFDEHGQAAVESPQRATHFATPKSARDMIGWLKWGHAEWAKHVELVVEVY